MRLPCIKNKGEVTDPAATSRLAQHSPGWNWARPCRSNTLLFIIKTHRYSSFHDQNPYSFVHDQNSNSSFHDQNPYSSFHDQKPFSSLHDQNPTLLFMIKTHSFFMIKTATICLLCLGSAIGFIADQNPDFVITLIFQIFLSKIYFKWATVLRIRIRDPGPFKPLEPDPRSETGLFRIRDLEFRIPNLYFLELSDKFLGKKFYNSLKTGPNFFSSAFKK